MVRSGSKANSHEAFDRGQYTVCRFRPKSVDWQRAVAVVYSSYPFDPRPRRAAEALAKEGASVEVICLKETEEEPVHESLNGVDITRVPIKHRRGGKLSYLVQYGSFILLSGAIFTEHVSLAGSHDHGKNVSGSHEPSN